MDGGTQPVNGSLRRRLWRWIAGVTLASGLAAGLCSYLISFREAQELQDDQLRQMALLMERHPETADGWMSPLGSVDGNDRDARTVVCPLGVAPKNPKLPVLPGTLPEGFQTRVHHGTAWRLYVFTLPSGVRLATGQMTAVRNEIARDSALLTLIPILLLVPALSLLAAWIIGRALAPVTHLSHQLDRRDDTNLTPIAAHGVPSEIRPFVAAINGLMQRLATALEQQRRFIADAAHELRSPLTALTVQTDNLEQSISSPEGKQRVMQLKAGLERAGKLLEQLLSLARRQAGAAPATDVPFDRLVQQVIEDYVPFAATKRIDFGCDRFEEVALTAPAEDLLVLARNAVDNALRYTPQGGRVDVSLYHDGGEMVFQVEDTGPGIPSGEEERLFEPFYRVVGSDETGSGLGLAIIRSIADRLGGTVSLNNRKGTKGALFRYRQPLTQNNR
ncbi:ATP-binding protein [Geobacter grbiciae]|uniref:ATP-binding protein n=1 Tax=Geobacter grbiciae TaxID=155042 RepID=UPI001C02DDAA|nr:ATP-binding protein [Geobacter grbiciae]MBT1076249.1 histidine kinase [Geobacter grbiciae]